MVAKRIHAALPVAVYEEVVSALRRRNAGLATEHRLTLSRFLAETIEAALLKNKRLPVQEPDGSWPSLVRQYTEWLPLYRRENTIRAYGSALKLWAEWATHENLSPATVTHREIERWMKLQHEQGRGVQTLNHRLAALKSFWKFLRRDGINTAAGPDQVMRPRKESRLPAVAAPAEIDKLIHTLLSIGDDNAMRDAAVVGMLGLAGLRVSEVVSMRVDDFQSDRLFIRNGKGAKDRVVPIVPRLLGILNAYSPSRARLLGGHASPYLIVPLRLVQRPYRAKRGATLPASATRCGRKSVGQQLGRHAIGFMLAERCTSILGKALNPHAFRHGFATNLRSMDIDLQTISEVLGHSSLQTTQIYAHLDSDSMLRKIAKATDALAAESFMR